MVGNPCRDRRERPRAPSASPSRRRLRSVQGPPLGFRKAAPRASVNRANGKHGYRFSLDRCRCLPAVIAERIAGHSGFAMAKAPPLALDAPRFDASRSRADYSPRSANRAGSHSASSRHTIRSASNRWQSDRVSCRCGSCAWCADWRRAYAIARLRSQRRGNSDAWADDGCTMTLASRFLLGCISTGGSTVRAVLVKRGPTSVPTTSPRLLRMPHGAIKAVAPGTLHG